MESNSFLNLLLAAVPLGIGFAICYYLLVVVPRQKRQAFQNFADKFGLSYQPRGFVLYGGMLPGKISNVVQGVDPTSKKTVSLFHLYHVTGSGKNRREYRRTVVAVTIKKTNLHAYVNSKLNDLKEVVNLARSQRYVAEGSFGKYFDLYFPDDNEVNSLAVFAPDALKLIMAHYGMYDIEIKGNQLYLYDYQFLDSSEGLGAFYQLGVQLAKEIDSNAPRALNVHSAQSSADAGGISSLKRGGLTPTAIVTIFIILVGIFSGPFDNLISDALGLQRVGSFPFPLVMVGMVLLVLIGVGRNAKLRHDYQKERIHFQEDSHKNK